jgi:putative ABC transport system permease protein
VFKNYLKVMLRNLKKFKGYSFINIFGLAVGMTCCILILLYVTDELSYDRHFPNRDRIYRIHTFSGIGATTRHYAHTPPILAPGLADSIPEVEAATRIFFNFNLQGRDQDRDVEIRDVFVADPNFFEVFAFGIVQGGAETALADPDGLVLTEGTARRLFGAQNPLGKVITLPGNPPRSVRVSAVIEDVPRNTHFHFNGLLPSSFLRDQEGRPAPVLTAAYFCEAYGYFLLRDGARSADVESKMAVEAQAKWGDLYKERGTERTYLLQKVTDIHLRSGFEYEIEPVGDIDTVLVFAAIALFVLLIACFNFINLSTARSANRAREVGIRKVLGSRRKQLVRQFLNESLSLSLISLFLSLVIVTLVLPAFNALSGKHFSAAELGRWPLLLGFLGIVLLTGLAAGSFPAFLLSSFRPVTVLRGKFSSASRNSGLRKALVVVQFSISIFMIVGVLIMVRQLDYMKNKDLGFARDHLVVMPFFGNRRDEAMAARLDGLRDRIGQNPGVAAVSFSGNIPGRDLGYDAYLPEGGAQENTVRAQNYWVDHEFVKTLGIQLAAGRDFDRDLASDAGVAVLLNEKAAKAFGWGNDAVGKRIINVPRDNRVGHVVGVIKDFHSDTLKMEIPPTVLSLETNFFGFITARVRPANVSGTLAFLKSTLEEASRELYPNRQYQFDSWFVDDDFRAKYPAEDRSRKIFLVFGALAVLVACLGLYGLASFTLEQRTKEIGVRKILGASLKSLVGLVSKEFVRLVLVANLVAWPLAYFGMRRWLEGFAYRISIKPDLFLAAGAMAMTVALFTVAFHSFRAARTNPVDSLKYE